MQNEAHKITTAGISANLGVWDINQRHWLMAYLTACAENAGKAPQDINSFIPWLMDKTRRAELTRPYPSQAPPANSVQTHLNS